MTDPGLPDPPAERPPGGDPGSVPDTTPDSVPDSPVPGRDNPEIDDGELAPTD
jgi:hypothetical protein